MAVNWSDFTPVDSGVLTTSGTVDWSQFEPIKTPKPGVWSDIKNTLATGFQGIALDARELARRAFGEQFVGAVDTVDEWMHGKPSEEFIKGNIEKAQQALTPEMQAAMQKSWWNDETNSLGDAWKDPRAYLGNVMQSLPGTAVTMLPALAVARGMYAAQIAAKVAPEIAAAKAATAATIAGGLTEGLQQAGQTGREVRDQILALDQGQLADSVVLKSMMDSGLSFEDARAKLAEDASGKAMTIAGVATGIFGGLGDRVLAKAFTRGLSGNLATRIAKGAAAEGVLEELPQSYLSRVGANVGMQEALPATPTTQGALSEGLGGMVAGGIMGGGIATMSKKAPGLIEAARQPPPPTVEPAPITPPAGAPEITNPVTPILSAGSIDEAIAQTSQILEAPAEIPAQTPQEALGRIEPIQPATQPEIVAPAPATQALDVVPEQPITMQQEAQNAPQIESPGALDVGQQARNGQTLGEGNARPQEVAGAGQVQAEGPNQQRPVRAPQQVAGQAVDTIPTARLQEIAANPDTPAITSHAAIAAIQARQAEVAPAVAAPAGGIETPIENAPILAKTAIETGANQVKTAENGINPPVTENSGRPILNSDFEAQQIAEKSRLQGVVAGKQAEPPINQPVVAEKHPVTAAKPAVAAPEGVTERTKRAEWASLGSDVSAALPANASRFKPQPRDFIEAAKQLEISPADASIAWRIFNDESNPLPARRSPRGITTQAQVEAAAAQSTPKPTPPAAAQSVSVPPPEAAVGTLRTHVEALIKRRSAASQIGKDRALDNAITLAKKALAGEAVNANRFKIYAGALKADQPSVEALNGIAAALKVPRVTVKVEDKAAKVAPAVAQPDTASSLNKHFGAGGFGAPVHVVYSKQGEPIFWSASKKGAETWADKKSYGVAAGATIKRVTKKEWQQGKVTEQPVRSAGYEKKLSDRRGAYAKSAKSASTEKLEDTLKQIGEVPAWPSDGIDLMRKQAIEAELANRRNQPVTDAKPVTAAPEPYKPAVAKPAEAPKETAQPKVVKPEPAKPVSEMSPSELLRAAADKLEQPVEPAEQGKGEGVEQPAPVESAPAPQQENEGKARFNRNDRDERNIETATRRMGKFLDEYVSGRLKGYDTQILGPTPTVLQALGAEALNLQIDGATVDKVLGGKHSYLMTPALMRQLPGAIYDPLMVFNSPADGASGKLLLTELRDRLGNPVIVAVHLSKLADRMTINNIASAYGMDNAPSRLLARAKQLEYYRNEESLAPSTTPGQLNLPDVVQTARDSGAILKTEADVVKQFGKFFSRAPSLTLGIKPEDVRAVIARYRLSMRGAPAVNVLENVDQAPAELLNQITREGAENDIAGAWHNGEIYLFANHLNSVEHAGWVLMHESTHHGLRGLVGNNLDPLMLDVYASNKSIRDQANALKKKDGNLSTVRATEEVLANLGGDNIPLPVMQKIMAAIRKILRQLGVVDQWTDNDVRGLIHDALETVKNPTKTGWMRGTTFSKSDQTDTPEFRKWFGNSKVVDAQGRPLVVYHGTKSNITMFDKTKAGASDPGLFGRAFYFTPTPEQGGDFAENRYYGRGESPNVMPVFVSLQNPMLVVDGKLPDGRTLTQAHPDGITRQSGAALQRDAAKAGNDGVIFKTADGDITQVVAFRPEQIKSAVGNRGTFDPNNPDIRFSRNTAGSANPEITAPDWVKAMPADMQETLRKAGAWRPKQTLQDRMAGWAENWQQKLKQGIVDQFDPIKSLDFHAYMLARMSKSAAGPLETTLFDGTIYLDKDGAVDVNYEKGGFIAKMQALKGEHDRFFSWVIGNRAERLMTEGREHNFTKEDIARLKSLNQGDMEGGKRAAVYMKALSDLTRYNKSIVDMAEKAGLVDAESRPFWEKEFYIPFYRMTEGDETKGPVKKGGLVRQYAFKTLKGGNEAIGDPMENILKNWAHLIDASLKNQAAVASIDAAEKIGIARVTDSSEKGAVFVMKNGEKTYYAVDDPFVLDAINSLGFSGFGGPAMKVMSAFKRWLTYGVTIGPSFRIRNVIRDSISMIGTNPASYNVLDNVLTGWKMTREGSPEYASMIAGGGVIRFGTMETESAANIKRIVASGVDAGTILDSPAKIKSMLKDAYDWWMRMGDRSENMNRAALYQKLRDEGKSHLEASYAARDTMDFSMQGTWSAIRFLAQTVPFFNARLQGMYKLGRGAAEDPRRFAYVVGASALASIALLLAYKDDDDWKRREDFDRETYWWFRIGDKAFRIPKPFEIGAIGTLAERGLEAMITDDLTGKQFAGRMGAVVMQQLSMNPVPQLLMPMIETWANRSAFTGRPIESMGMQNLSKSERIAPNTSAFAQLVGKNGLVSPVQIDHLINGYFGWLGMHAIATADLAMRPVMDLPQKPAPRIDEIFVLGDFVRDMPAYQSKYVTHLYENGKAVQEAMADLRMAQKIGATEKAAEILQDKGDKIRLYRLYTHAERQLTQINQQIRRTQLRQGDPEEKRARLDQLYQQRNRVAEITEKRAQLSR